jgi:hypothetical protein
MADLKISGKMKVKTLKKMFKEAFGLSIRLYDGRSFADDNSTLASIRRSDTKGGEFTVKANMKVVNFENKLLKEFGIKSQIAGSDNSYLCDDEITLSDAKEKDKRRIAKKGKIKLSKESEFDKFPDEKTNQKGEIMDDQQIIEFELTDAYDINIEYQDFSIEDLRKIDLAELYDQFVDAEERQEYYFHDEDFKHIKIIANGSDCPFTVNKKELDIGEREVRIISFYYYDETEYLPCEMNLPSTKDVKITMDVKKLCDGVEFVDSISLEEGYNEELDNDEMYFELDSAYPSDEDGEKVKIYISDNTGILAKISDVDEEDSKNLFIKTIEDLIA